MKEITIAVSGLPNSGSTTVGTLVARHFRYECFSPGRVFKDIAAGTFSQQYYYPLFKRLSDEYNLSIPSFHENNQTKGTLALWDTDFGKSPAFHKVIDELQKELATHKSIVIDGKLSLHMLSHADLKIWLTASLAARVARVMTRDSLTSKEAELYLPKRENTEAAEWKKIYGIDYREQYKHAHLTIDTSDSSPEEIAAKIITFAEDRF